MANPRRTPRLQLDFRWGLPVYVQIVKQVERQAAGGRLRPGDRLPTVRGLAADLGVHFNTVARAYRALDELGVVSTQQGRGTYILKHMPRSAARSKNKTLEALARRYIGKAKRHKFTEAEIEGMVRRILDFRL
jgi:DNA-binding transcriptional regulator YhcF (GntR family)